MENHTAILVTVCQASHATHNTENIVVNGVDTDLSGVCTLDAGVRKDKLEGSVINSGEVA